MSSINPETVVSVLKDQIENYDQKTEVKEEGRIIQIADGIATVYGMDQAMYGELVIFETGVHGLVLNVERNCIGCVLLGSDHGLMEGSKVARTGVQADIPVGDAMIGRVVNAIGEPIDGKGEIKTDERRPIEHEAAGVIDRKSVDQPLQTGILAIDSMFPIGRGQRELIIGDRQTGKTSIAVDTILNQKGQDVICIYVAIGQKASTVSQIVTTLSKHGAMDYSIVVSASASDLASLQYIAPYAGTAIAEHFMHQGKDVLIVYDDLSKHAGFIFLACELDLGCIIALRVSSAMKKLRETEPKGVKISSYSIIPLSTKRPPSSKRERFFILSISPSLISPKSVPSSRKEPLSCSPYSSFKSAKKITCSLSSKLLSLKICSHGKRVLLIFSLAPMAFSMLLIF